MTIKRRTFNFKVVPAYSNTVGLVRLHLMRYVDLHELLLCPDDPTLFGTPSPSMQITLFADTPPLDFSREGPPRCLQGIQNRKTLIPDYPGHQYLISTL